MRVNLRKLLFRASWTIANLSDFLMMTAAHAANPVPTVTGPTHPQAVVPGHADFVLTVYGANFVSVRW